MAEYELKKGQGSAFQNNKKQKETHPDYRGKIKTPDGKEWQLSLWNKQGKDASYFSISIQEPYQANTEQLDNKPMGGPDDDLPF